MSLDDAEKRLVEDLLECADIEMATDPPDWLPSPDGTEERLLEQVKAIHREVGNDLDCDEYFSNSVARYVHYLTIARSFKPGTRVLEVGSAPGHISICLHLLDFDLVGINLNEHYRSFYPSEEWFEKLNVVEHNIEQEEVPFEDGSFEAIFFTEVLEHIAIKHPDTIISDFYRLLRPGGKLILSTPNMCCISNIHALVKGGNIFWPLDMFYGGLDRHNREYTPQEVRDVLRKAGFENLDIYGINCPSNWNHNDPEYPNLVLEQFGENHPLCKNTIMAIATKGLRNS